MRGSKLLGAESGANACRLKFTPPFRSTLRPPTTELTLGPGELDPIREALDQIAVTAAGRGTTSPTAAPTNLLKRMAEVGNQLYELILPEDVKGELRPPCLFLEVGADESLHEFPWELLNDGDDFLCLKHSVGRFVNVAKPTIPTLQRPEALPKDVLSVLLISVPRPPKRSACSYDALPAAEAETTAIVNTLSKLGGQVRLSMLKGAQATWDAVFKAIKAPGRHHIVHFNGHAYLNRERPHASALVLHDKDMSTGQIAKLFGIKPPVFFFMNACETATAGNPDGAAWRTRYDIFGLARAFLDTGAYLIGNRTKVGDGAAEVFAKTFYEELIASRTVGEAIKHARLACKARASADDLSWASYVYYGDPRIRFVRTAAVKPGGE